MGFPRKLWISFTFGTNLPQVFLHGFGVPRFFFGNVELGSLTFCFPRVSVQELPWAFFDRLWFRSYFVRFFSLSRLLGLGFPSCFARFACLGFLRKVWISSCFAMFLAIVSLCLAFPRPPTLHPLCMFSFTEEFLHVLEVWSL